jgi:hypothetical protein
MTDPIWEPKTREDWTGLFKDAFKGANTELRSEQEEEEAKRLAAEAANAPSNDKDGKGGNGDPGTGKKRGFADRLLGR